MNYVLKIILIMSTIVLSTSCNFLERLSQKGEEIKNYKSSSLTMAKNQRLLQAKINTLHFQVEELTNENEYLKLKLSEQVISDESRKPASLAPLANLENDLIQQDLYQWTPQQLLSLGHKDFLAKSYVRSAQYFYTFIALEKEHKSLDDDILFQAGIAAYKSKVHNEWAVEHFNRIIKHYPESPHFRGAKLWKSLASLRNGNKDEFFETVEEFRLKYRNTPEWDLLREHYEAITQKYKN